LAKSEKKTTKTEEKEVKRSLKRSTIGMVTKISNDRSFKVRVETKFQHPKYGKIIKKHKSYLVDKQATEEVQVGNTVTIEECRPVSKNKRFKLVKVNSKE